MLHGLGSKAWAISPVQSAQSIPTAPQEHLTSKDCMPTLTSGLFTGIRADSDFQPEPQVWERSQHVLAFWGGGGRKRRRKKKDSFQTACCLPLPPRGRTNWGQSGWDSKQKGLCTLEASNLDPRAPETELEDRACGGGGWWGGQWVGQIPKALCPALSPGASVKSLQTNSMGKTARRNDKGVCELGRGFTNQAGQGHGRSPLPYLDFAGLTTVLIKQLLY